MVVEGTDDPRSFSILNAVSITETSFEKPGSQWQRGAYPSSRELAGTETTICVLHAPDNRSAILLEVNQLVIHSAYDMSVATGGPAE